jgi:hypothetical protein
LISIGSKSRYAVVALAELARSGDRSVPIKELAERREIPEQFLEQLFSIGRSVAALGRAALLRLDPRDRRRRRHRFVKRRGGALSRP